jgi:hypothetical protein
MRTKMTGSSKARPKAKITVIDRDRYSLTRASSWIGKAPAAAGASKLRKNFHAIGNTT